MGIWKNFKEAIFKSNKQDNFQADTGKKGTQDYKLSTYPFLHDTAPSYLSLYRELRDNVSVLDNAVETYALLVNSGYIIHSDEERDVDITNEVLERINFYEELNAMLQQTFTYGYNGFEVVLSSQMNDILRLVNVPSEDLRIKRDKRAQIDEYLQINTAGGGGNDAAISLNPNRFIWFTKDANTSDPYGRSLYKSLPFLTRIMLQMQDSIGKIYNKYGSPRFHVVYNPTIQLDQSTLNSRLNTIKEKFDDPEVGEDFFTAGDVEVTMIGSEGETLKFNVEMSEIMQGIFSGIKLPAGVLGYNYGSTETHLEKQIEILLGRVFSYQKQFAAIINHKFMPLVARVYNLSTIPVLEFKRPIIIDEKVEAEVEKQKIENVQALLELKLINKENALNRLGLSQLKGRK